jgi:hypothetical protein
MNIKEIVKEIAEREGKTKEVSIGNIREILGIVADLLYVDDDTVIAVLSLGKRRYIKRNGRNGITK